MKLAAKSKEFLFREVSASSLGMMRIMVGIFLLEDIYGFHPYFTETLSQSKFFFTYDGFHWVHLLPNYLLDVFFGVAIFSLVMFILGIHYRLNAILAFVSMSYCFLIDKAHYNNHFYLYCMMLFFFCIIDANRWGAVQKTEKKTVPFWQIFIFQAQLFIVYFYGSIAKIQGDWLSGFPMRFWLYEVSYYSYMPEFVIPFMRSEFGAYFMSYGGLLFDGLIGFMLLSKKLRRWALIPILLFHTSNNFLWNIGTFPFVMLAATPIFFAPDWAKKFYAAVRRRDPLIKIVGVITAVNISFALYYIYSDFYFFRRIYFYTFYLINLSMLIYLFLGIDLKTDSKPKPDSTTSDLHRHRLVMGFLTVWFSFQVLFPFRQWLYKGNPSWTGEGHLFAWRMMLVGTVNALKLEVIVPETGERIPVGLEHYMSFNQFRKMQRTPKNTLRFAHFIRDEVKKNGLKDPFIRMEMWRSVNGRPPQLLNDTTLNYAKVEYSAVKAVDWMTDWNESDIQPVFDTVAFTHWQDWRQSHDSVGVKEFFPF